MWDAQSEAVDANVHRYTLTELGKPMTYLQVIRYWAGNSAFNDYFSAVLAASEFPAFFWECAPLSRATLGQTFEFVLANSPQLAGVRADPAPFLAYCRRRPPGDEVVRFDNLGGDAVLVTPCTEAADTDWPHLAGFVRTAPARIRHEFWSCAGAAIFDNLDQRPLWISTSGLGVYWLHLRLDTRPKYYTFEPYRRIG